MIYVTHTIKMHLIRPTKRKLDQVWKVLFVKKAIDFIRKQQIDDTLFLYSFCALGPLHLTADYKKIVVSSVLSLCIL